MHNLRDTETKDPKALAFPVVGTVRLVKGTWAPSFPLAHSAVTSTRAHELIPGASCMSGSSVLTASHWKPLWSSPLSCAAAGSLVTRHPHPFPLSRTVYKKVCGYKSLP